jgi:membrane fusion protein (multidrug efflux system)
MDRRSGRDKTRRFSAALLVLAFLSACGGDPPPPPALKLPVLTISDQALPLALNYTARTRGEREVEVRARVSGILLRRYYREGEQIAAGARMFQIDPAPFAAEVRRAQGRLGVEQARFTAAELQWRRVEKLVASGFVSISGRDAAEAEYLGGKAAVSAARADLERARLDLGYTDVRAPISGVTGREARSEGSYVDATADSALLTTITQSSRLDIEFSIPEDEARLIGDALAARPGSLTVKLAGTSGVALPREARIDYISPRVNPDTGTVDLKAVYDNADGALSAGQFVRAEIAGLSSGEGAYIPVRAVLHSGSGPTVWVLDKSGKASIRPIVLGSGNGNMIRVAKGLGRGDRVVIDGILKLQPGAAVDPLPWKPQQGPAPAP